MRSVNIVSKILLVFFVVMLMLMIAAATNCAITKKRYKVLKVFFDGVPDPNARKESPSPSTQDEQPADQKVKRPPSDWVTIKSRHPDYYERNCNNCHNKSASNFLKAAREKFCFLCHNDSGFKGEFLHGPVASSDCLVCHLPHQSQHKYLLKETDANMCLECHMKEDVALNPVHAGFDFDKGECTQCHYAHTAASRFFLKNR